MFYVEPSSPGTAFGQIALFLTFLVNIWVQWRKDKQARKDATDAKEEVKAAAERTRLELVAHEKRMKEDLVKRAEEIKAASKKRMENLTTRLNGLLEPHSPDPYTPSTSLPQKVQDGVADRTHKLDAMAQTLAPLNARQQAYRRIIKGVKAGMVAYYNRFPDRALDERSKDAEEWSFRGAQDIINVLDDYSIEFSDKNNHLGGT